MSKKVSIIVTILIISFLALTTGCVSTEQVMSLENEVTALQGELDTVQARNSELESMLSGYVTKTDLSSSIRDFVTKADLVETQRVRDNLINGLSAELQSAQETVNSMIAELESNNEVEISKLSEQINSIESEFDQFSFVITEMMTYGGYSSSNEILGFVYGLVDMYETISDVEAKLERLKEAMRYFIEE